MGNTQAPSSKTPTPSWTRAERQVKDKPTAVACVAGILEKWVPYGQEQWHRSRRALPRPQPQRSERDSMLVVPLLAMSTVLHRRFSRSCHLLVWSLKAPIRHADPSSMGPLPTVSGLCRPRVATTAGEPEDPADKKDQSNDPQNRVYEPEASKDQCQKQDNQNQSHNFLLMRSGALDDCVPCRATNDEASMSSVIR